LNQVSYDNSPAGTREREIRGLVKGMKHFGLKKGTILTRHQEETIKTPDAEIEVIPFPKWLLEA
jgi:predicted AAA+ superfamily ATPase